MFSAGPFGKARPTSTGRRNFPDSAKVAEIAGPWEVSFDPDWGGPEKASFEALEDWTKRPEKGIRYYSGTAVYRKSFDLGGPSILRSSSLDST